MSLIKFLNNNKTHKINLSFYPSESTKRVLLEFNNATDIPDESELLSGFVELNEHNLIEQGDFSEFIYLYRKFDDCPHYILSNTIDDIYHEPVPEEPVVIEPYAPTLEEVQYSKINELSSICSMYITNGVDVEIDGEYEHFSYKEEDQVNIKELFDLTLQSNTPMFYHSDNNGCKLYTVDQIISIYSMAAMNKMHHTTYFNQLKQYIKSLNNIDDIVAIVYGQELIDDYLATYNSAMQQAQCSMESLLSMRQNQSEA